MKIETVGDSIELMLDGFPFSFRLVDTGEGLALKYVDTFLEVELPASLRELPMVSAHLTNHVQWRSRHKVQDHGDHMTDAEFVRKGGNTCPLCGRAELESRGQLMVMDNMLTLPASCTACGRRVLVRLTIVGWSPYPGEPEGESHG